MIVSTTLCPPFTHIYWNTIPDQGTVSALSKLWMPLDKFTKLAMEGLERGDLSIVVGDYTIDSFEKYEKGKAEAVAQASSAMERLK